MGAQEGKRRYDSVHRAAQAERTRTEIARAARQLFVAQGWSATTVREVAREAGVSAPTVYAAYGNKTGLLCALTEAANHPADAQRMTAELQDAAGSPERQLLAMASYDRRLYEHSGELIALVREAGRTHPELAEAYRAGRREGDRVRERVFSAWPEGTLRSGLDVTTAVDIYAALCNPDVFTTLTVEREWEPDRIERWWGRALTRELLARER